MNITLFEQNAEALYPVTLTRAQFDISVGGITLAELVKKFFNAELNFEVREHLKDFYKGKEEKGLHINGALLPSVKYLQEIKEIMEKEKEFVIKNKEGIVVVFTEDKLAKDDFIEKDFKLLNFPWETIKFNEELLKENLEFLKKDFEEKQKGVFLGKNVRIQGAVLNASKGPIIIDENTEIMPFAYLEGPLFIGKNCLIIEHASVKNSVIRNNCKVAGEFFESVMENYSNKAHFGHIGHSYIGSWVNLGAGTTNSDLKNTYGKVNVIYNGKKTNTEMLFLGTIIADYSKTGINTTIMTGKMIGVNSSVIGLTTGDVPSFTNAINNKKIEFMFDAAIKTQQRMFKRRNIEQEDKHKKLLEDVFKMTEDERKDVAKEKLSF